MKADGTSMDSQSISEYQVKIGAGRQVGRVVVFILCEFLKASGCTSLEKERGWMDP